MLRKTPYTRAMVGQVAEIPAQLLHHLRRSKPLARPEKHRFGAGWRQYLLLWMPPTGVPAKNSVVMLYHGGGWRVGWPGLHPTLAEFFLREGFPVVMPAYRLSPWASHREMRGDLSRALRTTLQLMQERNIGHKNLLVGGMSAGATLAAHLVFDRAELAKSGLEQSLFSGFMSFAGPLDLEQMPPFGAVRNYAGGRPGSGAFRTANPIHHLLTLALRAHSKQLTEWVIYFCFEIKFYLFFCKANAVCKNALSKRFYPQLTFIPYEANLQIFDFQ